jgi:D-alanyl-D-alanine carboxypeptidase
MDRCEGMDGIKTGYTAASGFNLLSSVKRDGHYIVSVVMGGKSAPSRDNYMEALIEQHIDEAGAPGVRVASQEDSRASQDEEANAEQAAQAERAQQERQARAQQERDAKAQQEKLAKAEPVRAPQNLHPAYNAPQLQLAAVIPDARMRATPAVAHTAVDEDEDPVPTAVIPPRHPSTAETAAAPAPVARKIALRIPPPEAKPAIAKTVQTKSVPPAKPEKVEAKAEGKTEGKHAVFADSKPGVSGWMIQIGATDAADKASELLARAKTEQRAALASAHPFTEKVTKGKSTLYRARFAGLAENNAEAACKALKRSGFSCIAMRN